MEEYTIHWVRGEHIEVFLRGHFEFSADTLEEAKKEIKELIWREK